MRIRYEIKGMTCAACVAHVERAVGKLIGEGEEASVSLLTNSVSLTVSDATDVASLEKRLSAAIQQAGYELVTEKKENKSE